MQTGTGGGWMGRGDGGGNIRQRLGLNCFGKNHGEMKGIIQMTILEPLVHLLYHKLSRCCRHNNIKNFLPVFIVILAGLVRNFSLPLSPSLSHSHRVSISLGLTLVLLKIPPPPPQSETWEVTHKPRSKMVAGRETADWNQTWNTWHTPENNTSHTQKITQNNKITLHVTAYYFPVLVNNCIITHVVSFCFHIISSEHFKRGACS